MKQAIIRARKRRSHPKFARQIVKQLLCDHKPRKSNPGLNLGLNHERKLYCKSLPSRRSSRSRSCLLLHDQVRTANIARIATVASLNFWSLSVVHAKAAKTAYTTDATHNLFIPHPTAVAPTRIKHNHANWKARKPGAQGRIRTSVARKERQIYSLLPLTTRPPVHASTEHPALSHLLRAKSWARNRQSLLSKNTLAKHISPQSRNSAAAARPYFRA